MAETPDSDADLMLRVKRGDRRAFEVLVDRYRQPILNMVYRLVGDATEAEDLAQTAFVQAYRNAHRYRDSARFSTWLYTIARNLCYNELRRRSRHPTDSLDAPHPEHEDQPRHQPAAPGEASPTSQILHAELEGKIQEALNALPDNQRLAVVLCRQDELSYEEIARVVGCSVSATKSLIFRGRETLKLKLKPYLQTGVWGDPPD